MAKSDRIVIVMPTFNEKDNIGQMIDILVGEEFPKIKGHEMLLLVVDDKSPDGTGRIVQEKQSQYQNLQLLEGERAGLGAAYARGFRYAIDKLKADAVMEMDADFQHDPKDVKRFVRELENGADYIIGARYIGGGSIPKEWSPDRRFLSVVGNLIYRTTLFMFMPGLHDFTTGYRLAKVKGPFGKLDFNKVFTKSFTYKTRLLYEMHKSGAKIKEIPITFDVRRSGDSKSTTNLIFDNLKLIAEIWKERLLS